MLPSSRRYLLVLVIVTRPLRRSKTGQCRRGQNVWCLCPYDLMKNRKRKRRCLAFVSSGLAQLYLGAEARYSKPGLSKVLPATKGKRERGKEAKTDREREKGLLFLLGKRRLLPLCSRLVLPARVRARCSIPHLEPYLITALLKRSYLCSRRVDLFGLVLLPASTTPTTRQRRRLSLPPLPPPTVTSLGERNPPLARRNFFLFLFFS